jgi:Domain of unknown function (DUF4403)
MASASRKNLFSLRHIILGALVVTVFFGGTLWALNTFFPASNPAVKDRPALAQMPPLPLISRTSLIIAPVAITHAAIRDALEAAAPRNLSGKRDNPLSQALGQLDIGWTLSRSPLSVAGRAEGLTLATNLTGVLRVTGQAAQGAGGLLGSITGAISPELGRNAQNLATGLLDQRAEIKSNVIVTARPQFLPTWRIEPNLSGQVAVADGGLSVVGIKINVSNEVKPFIDKAVSESIGTLQSQLRNDPTIEQVARREWAKMCRSVSFAAAGAGAPNLWLELRPTRAFAAHPRVDANNVTLTVGVQAETRIVPSETKPNCPFPSQLQIVPPLDQGKVAIAAPIDIPFTEVNRLMELQLKGKKFPDDPNAAAEVTVLRVNIAPSGDRLLISMRVKAREKKSWFGFGAEANVHVWGKPQLDPAKQILKLTDITLDVDSEAAFGLLGAAARAAIPYMKDALEENAVVDLKPFAASARTSIAAAIADFQKQEDGVRAEANVTGLRLMEIAYDSRTLRVVAEAEGGVKVTVTKLPAQ